MDGNGCHGTACAMKTKPKSAGKMRAAPTLAATVAGEDLACGDFVALLHEFVDVPSYMWPCDGFRLSPHELVRLKFFPSQAGQPLRVITICLPFVYAKSADGVLTTIDTRQAQLVRLDRRCAKSVWKALRSGGTPAAADPP